MFGFSSKGKENGAIGAWAVGSICVLLRGYCSTEKENFHLSFGKRSN